ncbi:hypothetical protein DYB25_010834 [Aphanomyces astaci]|uniref:EXS domain-containing protein n=1 Tax=Aphanomyces astaci TaxID=112090 RepID=A0A397BN97_APHAT|nr:hypothetical protein DYB25_010834 [Aphanomyces astaci]
MSLTLYCTIVNDGSTIEVEVGACALVEQLRKKIAEKMQYTFPEHELKLYLAKLANGEWLQWRDKAVDKLRTHEVTGVIKALLANREMDPTSGLENPAFNFPSIDSQQDSTIHVLVRVPSERWDEVRPHKKHKVSSTDNYNEEKNETVEGVQGATSIPPDVIASIEGPLGLFPPLEVGSGVALGIDLIESDFPKWFFMRQAAKDVIKTCNALAPLFVVLNGSPGNGKSTLVVLLAFYKALYVKTPVMLIRRRKGPGGRTSMLCLDPVNAKYWRNDDATIKQLKAFRRRYKGFALYLDGFDKAFVFQHDLDRFQLLATPGQYRLKSDDMPHYELCLVPFWSKPDLIAIGHHEGWDEPAINGKYFYSGGNLRYFLMPQRKAKQAVDIAIASIVPGTAEHLDSQRGATSPHPIDTIRMRGIQPMDPVTDSNADGTTPNNYLEIAQWIYAITSEYALRRLAQIIPPSKFQAICLTGHNLGDGPFKGIAFENYVHNLAMQHNKIDLKVLEYQPKQTAGVASVYADETFEAKAPETSGNNTVECDAAMVGMASSPVDYWCPYTCSLPTIDCVAKLTIGGQEWVALIQITTCNTHNIDVEALESYASHFPEWNCCYIALVPDKETCDGFRLAPVEPHTRVPLKWFRFLQSLRRIYDMKLWWPGVGNVIKFALAQIVVLFGIFHPFHNPTKPTEDITPLQQVWIAGFIVFSFILWFWDLTMDWGLGRPQFKFLAERHMYRRGSLYYGAYITLMSV